MADTAPKPKRSFFRVCLRCLRWCRITLVFLALIVVLAVLYLKQAGLPDFLKRPLLANLKARGIELQFSRMRWHWVQGIFAEDVRFGATRETKGLQLEFKEAGLELDHAALFHRQIKVNAVTVRGGNLVLPLAETNEPTEMLSLTNFQATLALLPDDEWELSNFSADFAGVHLTLSGDIQHASAIRQWKIFEGRGTSSGLLNTRLRRFAQTLERIHFKEPPVLNVIVHGDARDPASLDGMILLKAPTAETPWGDFSDGDLMLRLQPSAKSGGMSEVDLRLYASQITTSWASARLFRLDVHVLGDDELTNLVRVNLELSATNVLTPWAQSTNASFKANWSHSITNFIPSDGEGELVVANPQTRWAAADTARLHFGFSGRGTNSASLADDTWGWWRNLEPYILNWNCRFEHVRAQDFESQELTCGGEWNAPELVITNLHTEMYQGRLDGKGTLNVGTRAADLTLTSDFDALKIYSALPPSGRTWLDRQQIGWDAPPLVKGSVSVILPAWTNQHPDWRGEVVPTLAIAGDFKVGAASYRRVPMLSAGSHITFSNQTWTLSDMTIVRPEGRVELTHVSNERTREYYFKVRSSVDVKVVRGWLEPKAQAIFDRFGVAQPPLVEAEIWGQWQERDRIGVKAIVTVSNFSYQAESATYFKGNLDYTNKFLLLTAARLERTNQYMTADGVGFDFVAQKGWLTNGQGVFDPMVLCRTIGPRTAEAIAPYHFLEPPAAVANGVIPLSQDISTADLHFKINGGPFVWQKLHLPRISGLVDWQGEDLSLRDIKADFYQGSAGGDAKFDFRNKHGTDYSFNAEASGVNLHALMSDVASNTTHLEGIMGGELRITQANTQDLMSWFGNGRVEIRDGLIWEIPIFGILSPVLDSISPGLGKSRVKEGSALFVITNGVARSDDLELRSPTITLLYRGTVDFKTKVDARVEASFGREVPVLGVLVSTVFTPIGKLFETRVTGTLHEPKYEPVLWVTRVITPLMHPWRTLFNLFPAQSSSATNSPPKFPPAQ